MKIAGDVIYTDDIGVGTSNPVTELTVNGIITCEEVDVIVDVFPDHVFDEDHEMMSLHDLEQYIQQHNRLPKMPSEKEVLENGLGLGKLSIILTEKIEEITLHLIQLNKENEALRKKVEQLDRVIANK